MPNNPLRKPIKGENPSSTKYILNFGRTYLNTLQKQKFKIKNISEKNNYKFEFLPTNDVVFIPTVGHLSPLSTKEIIVTFMTTEPVVIYEVYQFYL